MSLRTRIFIFVSIGIIILLAILVVVWNRSKKNPPSTPTSTVVDTVNDTSSFQVIDANNFDTTKISTSTRAIEQPKQFTSEEATEQSLKQLAKIFIERYGTYSTDNNFQNILDVQTLVTPSLWNTIKPNGVKNAGSFIGITTQAVTSEIVDKKPDALTIRVKTIRNEQKGTKINSLQQSVLVTLVKQNSSWLINAFSWEK